MSIAARKHRFLLAAVAAGAAAAAVGLAGSYLLPARDSGEASLLTLAGSEVRAVIESSSPARTTIALARAGEEARILTGSFWSAASPSASIDGRRFLFAGRGAAGEPTRIWEMAIDGSTPRLVTTGNGDPGDPLYLPDERIVYSDAAGEKAGPRGARALFSCRHDGSDVSRLTFGPHADGRPRLLDDGRILFERRFRTTRQARAPAWMTIHPDGTQVAMFGDGSAASAEVAQAAVIGPVPGYAVIGIEAALARPAPPILTSVVRPDVGSGTLLCLNVYASRLAGVARLPAGAIERVVARRAVVSSAEEPDGPSESILGEAPVFPDGSFFIEVPADTPLNLALMGSGGRVVASLNSGIWVRPNENRGCIGCHEETDLAPDNRRPMAIAGLPVPLLGPSSGDAGGRGDHAP